MVPRRGSVYDEEKGRLVWEYYATPHCRLNEQPVLLIANGWGEGCDTLRVTAGRLAQAGREVYTFNHRRHTDAHDDPEAYKSTTLQSVYEEVAAQRDCISIIAHSEGAIGAVTMARRLVEEGRAEQLQSLSLVAPAGVAPIKPAHRLFWDGALEVAHHSLDFHTVRHIGRAALLSGSRYLVPHVHLSLRELQAVASSDLREDIAMLRRAGVPIGIIACTKDRLFPLEGVRRTAAELAESGIHYAEVDATHVHFLAKEQVVAAMLGQLNEIEQQEHKQNNYNVNPFDTASSA